MIIARTPDRPAPGLVGGVCAPPGGADRVASPSGVFPGAVLSRDTGEPPWASVNGLPDGNAPD